MDGQWALIEVSGVPTMQVLSNHMAATPAHYEYFWVPAVTIPPIPPVPQSAMQDQLLRWSQPDGRYVATQLVTGSSVTGIGTDRRPAER